MDAFWDCNEELKSIPFEYRTKAKTAITKFKFKFYDAVNDMSVIKCYPLTGRTHQIRVHLKHLGCPIANDQKYHSVIKNNEGKELSSILNNGVTKYGPENFETSY